MTGLHADVFPAYEFFAEPLGDRRLGEALKLRARPGDQGLGEKNDDEITVHAMQHALACSKRI
jgi:hypothetical protein